MPAAGGLLLRQHRIVAHEAPHLHGPLDVVVFLGRARVAVCRGRGGLPGGRRARAAEHPVVRIVVLQPAAERAARGSRRRGCRPGGHGGGRRRWGGGAAVRSRCAVIAPALRLRSRHHTGVQANGHRRGCRAGTGPGLEGPCRARSLTLGAARGVRNDRRRLSCVHVCVFCDREADAWASAVIDRDKAPQEGVAKDKEGPFWRGHVERHEGEGAITCALVHVVLRGQVEDLVAKLEADLRQGGKVGAVVLRAQLAAELVDKVRGPCKHGGASVDGHLATFAAAEARVLAVKGDVLYGHLPVGLAGDLRPDNVRGQLLRPVATKSDLAVAVIREEHGKLPLGQLPGITEVVNNVELLSHGEILEAQAKDPVKGRLRKRLRALRRGRDEADLRAEGLRDAELVLVVVAGDVACAKRNLGGTLAALVHDLRRRRGSRGVVLLVGLAPRHVAALGWQDEVAASGVKNHLELLGRSP
mmetsp:Transcript_56493/g.160372  ORF Transcript_56493/g.160372 Transcript_56493/m.160372 type:complete len:472 (-) Transcript_56493:311-1726(-)